MKKEEILEELGLCVRSFAEAKERASHKGIDKFDELRILEASFNRLFLATEHLCNAIALAETGNYSKKHFGDFQRLKDVREKYAVDVASVYQETYTFRAYADYRKNPDVKERFTKQELERQIAAVEVAILACFSVLGTQLSLTELLQRMKQK